MSDLLVRGVHLISMDPNAEQMVLRDVDVWVKEGRFHSIDPTGSQNAPVDSVPPERIVDGRGKLMLPGFINSHQHVSMSLLRGYGDDMPLMSWLTERVFPVEAKLTGEDVYWGALLGILEMIETGTVLFNDMYFFMEEVARAVEESGMRAILGRGLVPGDDAQEATKKLRESIDFAHTWQGAAGDRIRTVLTPHAPYTCPPAYIKEVLAAAKSEQLDIHIHLAETVDEVEFCQAHYGQRPIVLMQGLGMFDLGLHVVAAHCVHVTDEEIRIMADADVGVAHNPISNLKLGSGIAPLPQLLNSGIAVGLGTDGACSTNQLSMFEEMRFATLVQKGLHRDAELVPAETVLALATREGARCLGADKDLGMVRVGYQADFILLDLDRPHLVPQHDLLSLAVYSAQAGDVESVAVAGELIYHQHEHVRLDAERIRSEAARRAEQLVGKGEE